MMGLWVAVAAAAVGCLGHALAMPLPQEGSGGGERAWSGRQYVEAGLGVAALLTSVTTLLACACCKRSRGFKRTDSGHEELGSVSSRVAGSSSTLTQGPREEITLFPPAGLSLSTTQINFEPLPDIRPRPSALGHARPTSDRTLPPFFPGRSPSSPAAAPPTPTDEWFAEPHQSFPRNQLQYVRELGQGWFGQVLEGRASGVFSDHTKGESPVSTTVGSGGLTPVAVKVLREDASPSEQQYFLQELRPYRDLSHPNVLRVLAHCLEAEPFLILLQLCPRGDLKAVLRSDRSLSEVTLLRMTLDVASGLTHMHAHNFIHTDLAARNCVVEEDNSVKIGDYGFSLNSYKDEYYCAGDVALPLRWCSPETLKCTDTTIETKEVTKAANVWSFGVVMWEIASRGDLPYNHLDHEQVIQDVIVDQTTQLDLPSNLQLHAGKLYNIMKQCWEGEESRPAMMHTHSLLAHLWEHAAATPDQDTASLGDFELRWNQLQQPDCRDHSIMHTGNTSSLRFESDFNLSSAMDTQPLGEAMSPSLQNLHGSAEDLDARIDARFKPLPSWLGVEPGQQIDSLTQEITDAILKLDDYLAGEKSEPSTGQTSPEKGGVNFKLGKDSFVSNPPESIVARMGGLSIDDGRGHPSLTGALSEEEEGFSMKLEQGAFTEMVRLKSQSVQDFMKLTVVDDASDSDNTSQRNSLGFEPLSQEKTFSSEGNIKEALRDAKFMGDLERLQAEHRYSIITEVSRECASSIEYRNQGLNGDTLLSEDHQEDETLQSGSTDRLIVDAESEGSSNSHERLHSEQDPFLCKLISSETTEETVKKVCDSKEGKSAPSDDEIDSSVGTKPLPASPDCVVSSREPKPAALPDIVAHNGGSNLAHSSPSPPTSPSAFTHINSNQRKEFRFIFGTETAKGSKSPEEDLPDGPAQVMSVVFSENIKEEAGEGALKDSGQDKSVLGSTSDEKNLLNATEQIIKGIDSYDDRSDSDNIALDDKHFVEGRTSTPFKVLSLTRTEVMGEKDEVQNEYSNSEFSGSLRDSKESADINSSQDHEVKQRLVFSTSDSEEKDTSDKGEHGRNEVLASMKEKSVPSYTPEEIVKGEEVVIGALEDYSLDLYKAVKSTEDPPVSPSSDAPPAKLPESEDIKTSAEFSGIEFDLDQWDKFLGKTLSRENSCSDPVFTEGIIGDEDIACDAVNDSVAVGFEQDILNEENMSGNVTGSSNISDFVSAHEEVSSSIIGSGSSIQVLSESESSLKGNRETESKSATLPEITQQSNKVSSLSEALTEHQQTVQSEESFHTAASKMSTSPEHDKSPALVHNTTTTPSSATSAGLEEAVMEESMCSNTSWGEFPSPQFSYKKEAPVDTSFEQSCEVEPVSTNTKLKLDLAGGVLSGTPNHFSSDILDPVVHTSNSSYSVDSENFNLEKTPENLLLNNNVNSVPKTSEVINGLETEKSSSDVSGVSSALQFGSPGSVPHTTLIIQGEDDLSPSAYQGSWSARGDQEGAPRGDESESGDFWEQQMVAWQAAAFQTRQLLQEAAGQGEEGVVEEQTKRQEEEEVSPRSDASSSSKSLYSSTDLLNLDDEGTYVSYNTTDEEEVLGYRPEDISALRAELSLKLETGQGESQQQEPEEPEDPASLDRDNVVINYRGIISSTLSPIKEESFLEEDDTPGRRGSRGNVVEGDSVLDWSIEFEEPASSDCEESKSNTFVISDSSIMQPSVLLQMQPLSEAQTDIKADDSSSHSPEGGSGIAGEALVTSLENTHDSLILEDLDEEDGPTSIQIYNSGTSLDAEDILVVNTETNEATIVDQGKPRSHLAFVTEQEPPPETSPLHPLGFEDTDDVAPESIPSEEGRHLQQLQRREQATSGKPSWDQTDSHGTHEDEKSSESKSTTGFVITSNDAPSSSPEGIQVPAYHSYFTSALSSISHPNASLEEPPLYEQVEQISLPYEVNYPPPTALEEEELHSLEDVQQQQQGDGGTSGHNISEIEDDEDAAPIKLSFLGRLYSDEDKEEQHKKPKAEREATLLSDSEGEDLPDKLAIPPKNEEPSSLRHMTSAEFLASEKYKTNDAEEVEEQLTDVVDSEEDSEDENSPGGSPHKGEGASPASHEPRYTPDWETDSDTDDDSSSTSGEFMWKEEEEEKDKRVEEKPGEPCQPAPYILDIIEEEPHEDEEREEGELSEDSESGEEEFTPSQWNSDLTPSHSLLKSPQNKSSLKKRVRWKRQRHHRVYEYPPEPRSWEHSLTEPQYRRSWGRSSLDYLSLADWELGADEFIADESEDIEDSVYHKPSRPAPPPPIYSLGSMTYDEAAEGFLVDNGEFFIRSSGSPFTFTRSSFSASDFFPGGHSSDYDVIFGSTTQTVGVPFPSCKVPEGPPEVSEEQVTYSNTEERQLEEDLQASTLTQEDSEQQGGGSGSLGQLRHTRDKLRLEIPSLTLASDSSKGSPNALENGRSGLECSEQNFVIMNHNRVEPEVSEV